MASPLLGYNTNVRHRDKLFHIQTEDSGTKRAHIFTHLFADGGRIIASKKTTYSEHLESDNLSEIVRQLMKASHKAMFIALRDGLFDESEAEGRKKMTEMVIELPEELSRFSIPPAISTGAPAASPSPAARVEAEEDDAGATIVDQPAPSLDEEAEEEARPGRSSFYGLTQPIVPAEPTPLPRTSIFGAEPISEKSLDEVILSYLADELEDE